MKIFDPGAYAALARRTVAEGCVLLRNDGPVLPFAQGAKVAVFGRSQFNYYKSGTGSGGLVELQGTGEGRSFTLTEQQDLVRLCLKGGKELLAIQKEALGGKL